MTLTWNGKRFDWLNVAYFAGIHAGALLAPWTFSWSALGVFFLLYWLFFGHGRLASDETFPIGNNIVNRQDGKFLAMTATMAETLLRFVPENNQLFAAVLLNGSCKHHGIVQQRSTDHRAIGIRDK